MTETNFNEKFNLAYQKLNNEQRRAVDKIEGPLLVIAGPGTGKTQILATRIGQILRETDTAPENILCLTFTEAAAQNMRKRLYSLIGLLAYQIQIHTFHALCNEIIQDNLEYFPLYPDLEPISDIENLNYLRELIDSFSLNHPLKIIKGEPYYYLKDLNQLFTIIKKEGFSTQELIGSIDEKIKNIPDDPKYEYKKNIGSFKKGDKKQGQIIQEIEKLNRTKAAIAEFDNYKNLLLKYKRYDFNDMINWVVQSFTEFPLLLQIYQEKFQYILVDEYQDTSSNQNNIIEKLANFWEDNPNLFAVGDDDQCIFRFQGANISNMSFFLEKYIIPNVGTQAQEKMVVLLKNYRSTRNIIELAKSLINLNKNRISNIIPTLKIYKDFSCANSSLLNLNIPIEYNKFDSVVDEYSFVTLKIKDLIAKGIKPSQIAVLYKENKIGEELQEFLNCKNIKFNCSQAKNVLSDPMILQYFSVLKYIQNETQLDMPTENSNRSLFEILHYKSFDILPLHIMLMYLDFKKQFNLREIPENLRKLILKTQDNFNKNDGFNERYSAIIRVCENLENCLYEKRNYSLVEFLKLVFKNCGFLSKILNDKNYYQLELFDTFFNFLGQEMKKNPLKDLGFFITMIDDMIRENIPVLFSSSSNFDSSINLLTIHKAKGLEFEQVFIIQNSSKYWEKKRAPNMLFKLPENFKSNLKSSDSDDNLEELRRLFYVALTRASKFLYLSFATNDINNKPLETSQFILNLNKELNEIDSTKIDNEEAQAFLQSKYLKFTQNSEIKYCQDNQLKEFIEKQLEGFELSVSSLNNYLNCPLGFYFQNIIKIPSQTSPHLYFGSAIHKSLEKYFSQSKIVNKFLPVEDFKKIFSDLLNNKYREGFTANQLDDYNKYGCEILENYFKKFAADWRLEVNLEKKIKVHYENGLNIVGVLDKIEVDFNSIKITDYKTGNPDKCQDKLMPPCENNKLGGEYWRQAAFYHKLIKNSTEYRGQEISTRFSFIEPSKKDKNLIKDDVVIIINNQQLKDFNQCCEETWEKIKSMDFFKGCNEPDCEWCKLTNLTN